MDIYSFKSMLLGLLGAFLFLGCENSKTNGQEASTSKSAPQKEQVTLTEYSDFECPFCADFYPIVKKLKEHYGAKLKVEQRYFPLNSHQYSMLAARAAEAAANQNKYSAMHDLLFKNQKQWTSSGNPQPIFINYAKKIGLDMAQFKDDLNAAKTQKAVMEQKNEGMRLGVNSTPTFFINGQQVPTLPRNYEQFKALLDEFMKDLDHPNSTT